MDRRATHLDGDDGIEHSDSGLERLEEAVLVREHAILTRLYTKADASVDILHRRLEPSVSLCLRKR
jgi:hypothetical protein